MPDIKITNPKTKPTCPNHGFPLEGCGFPLPRKGTGTCPISGSSFEFEAEFDNDNSKIKKDKNGNLVKDSKWKISGND